MVSSVNRLNNSDQIEENEKTPVPEWFCSADSSSWISQWISKPAGCRKYIIMLQIVTQIMLAVCNVSQPSSQNSHIMQYSSGLF